MRSQIFGILCSLSLVAACESATVEGPDLAPAVESTAPSALTTGGTDQADRSCQLILRSTTRTPGGPDYATYCAEGVCTYLWSGQVDVSRDAFPEGATVGVLYHQAGDSAWWEVPAAQTEGGRPGFWTYGFQVSEHLFGPGLSEEQLASVRVELVPFVRLADGSRLFDHNRHTNDLESYSFGQAEWFAVGDDGTCPATGASLYFLDNWQTTQNGQLHQDGWLSVWFDLDRLPQCRGTHNGQPAWDTVANLRFLPGGQLSSGSVRRFVTEAGRPTNQAVEQALDVKIPSDATSVELWFSNASGAGGNCETWDSNFGANHRFPVLPARGDPRCQGVERWSGYYGGQETCLAYSVAEQFDATNCEFYLSGFGHGHEGHYGIPVDWLEAWVSVGPQQGEVLEVGLFTRYTDGADGAVKERFSLGVQKDAGTWKTGFTYLSAMPQGKSFSYSVQSVALFLDVRRPDGKVVRLWQSHGGANYSWDDAFGGGTTTSYIPYGNVQYANDGAAIFDARRACR